MNNFLDKMLDGRKSVFKLRNGQTYIFDKLIFVSIIIVLLSFSVFVLGSGGWNGKQNVYVNCNSSMKCYNPYYDSPICGKDIPSDHYLCTNEFVPANYTYGTPSPFYIQNFGLIAMCLIFAGLFTNHFIYNGRVNLLEGSNDTRA